MFSFIKKASIFQSNLLHDHRFKQMLKQRNYQIFLQRNTGYLPGLKKLQAWRKWLACTAILSLMPTSLMTIISWQWTYNDLVFLSPELTGIFSPAIICGSIFMILISFSAAFDHVIHKRYPTKSILGW